MKLCTLLMILGILQVSASSMAQKVTLNDNDTPLSQVFDQIRSQTGYDFAYTTSTLNDAKRVTIHVRNIEMKEVLGQLFEGQPLEYLVQDKSILVKAKILSFPEKPGNTLSPDKIDVHGGVIGEDGLPLSGATIIVKGGNGSTITNAKGLFILKNVDLNAIIVITYVGYEKMELAARNDLGVIRLKTSENKLDQIQVIAYGETTQRLTVGNVATVSGKTISDQPVANPLLALEGEAPGIFITQDKGMPGSGVTVLIQGQNSIQNGNDPLYVIDGVPYASEMLPNLGTYIVGTSGVSVNPTFTQGGNPLNYLNPGDIESISILKGADATSIYGSRAANGAVLITTKKGKPGETQVNFNTQNGWGKVTRMINELTTPQYIEMRLEALNNNGVTVGPFDYDINGAYDTTRYTNWQKVLEGGTAHYDDENLSVSGGSLTTQYLISTTFHHETSVYPGDFGDNKGSLHFNLNNQSQNGKFKITLSGNYQLDDNHLPNGDPTFVALTLPPDAPAPYTANGQLNWQLTPSGASTWANPLAMVLEGYNSKVNNMVLNSVMDYEIITGLHLMSNFGYTDMATRETQIFPLDALAPDIQPFAQRRASYNNSDLNSWIVEPQLSYKRTFGRSDLNLLIGSTIEQQNSTGTILNGTGYDSDLVLTDPHSAATTNVVGSTLSTYKYNALFGRAGYNYDGRYLFDFTGRRDGSSRFGSANEFHDFWSIGAGWIFSEEAPIKNNLTFLSFGKLRGSYGTTGNDQIGDYQFLNLYVPNTQGVPYQGISTLNPIGLPNPDLKWEETKKLEIGADLGFFKDCIVFNLTYYRNRSSNQLLYVNLPSQTGFSVIAENLPATVQNKGWEFTLKTINIKSGDFTWSTNFNFTAPSNKLLSFPGLATSLFANSYVIGQPLNVVKAFRFDGVNPQTGQYQFLDHNGNVTANPDYVADRTDLINISPQFYGGVGNSFRYKSLELNFLFQFVKQTGPNDIFGIFDPGEEGLNQPVSVLGRWRAPGDLSNVQAYDASGNAFYPSFADAESSNKGYSDASYIRLKNLSLSWQLPQKLIQSIHFKSARLYVQGQNLLTFTHYAGLDPESENLNSLPSLKMMTVGIQAGL